MMQAGRNSALSTALEELGKNINMSACILIDERGLLISEYIKTDIDKNAMAVMSSLLKGAGSRFIDPLKLIKLNLVTVNTRAGIFIIKEVPLPELGREFTISVYMKQENLKNLENIRKNRKNDSKFGKMLSRISKFIYPREEKNGKSNKMLIDCINRTISRIQDIFNQ